MPTPVKLIVGLGNPGDQYARTRHNVGAWYVEHLADHFHTPLRAESKFFGSIARITIESQSCWLLVPKTYMNESGKAVSALARFYKIETPEILVAHDELDFNTGDIRLKVGGGHGGHNGLRDIINHLHTRDFLRLRIGIGHPGHKDKVTPYVLSAPSRSDALKIDTALEEGFSIVPDMLAGELQRAMHYLHSS